MINLSKATVKFPCICWFDENISTSQTFFEELRTLTKIKAITYTWNPEFVEQFDVDKLIVCSGVTPSCKTKFKLKAFSDVHAKLYIGKTLDKTLMAYIGSANFCYPTMGDLMYKVRSNDARKLNNLFNDIWKFGGNQP